MDLSKAEDESAPTGEAMSGTPEEVIICRCEDVTLGEIRGLVSRGYTTFDEVKRISRCGMGPCQGRTCRQLVLAELARETGRDISSFAPAKFRPPTKPVRLGGASVDGPVDGRSRGSGAAGSKGDDDE